MSLFLSFFIIYRSLCKCPSPARYNTGEFINVVFCHFGGAKSWTARTENRRHYYIAKIDKSHFSEIYKCQFFINYRPKFLIVRDSIYQAIIYYPIYKIKLYHKNDQNLASKIILKLY
jgi:hypothetical protein